MNITNNTEVQLNTRYKINKEHNLGTVIYYLYKDSEIVYIGSTKNLWSRLSTHIKEKDFDSYEIEKTTEKDRYNDEARLIFKHSPKYNKTLPTNDIYAPISKIMTRGGFPKELLEPLYDIMGVEWNDKKYLILNESIEKYLNHIQKPLVDDDYIRLNTVSFQKKELSLIKKITPVLLRRYLKDIKNDNPLIINRGKWIYCLVKNMDELCDDAYNHFNLNYRYTYTNDDGIMDKANQGT
jgi:hypothetical protein